MEGGHVGLKVAVECWNCYKLGNMNWCQSLMVKLTARSCLQEYLAAELDMFFCLLLWFHIHSFQKFQFPAFLCCSESFFQLRFSIINFLQAPGKNYWLKRIVPQVGLSAKFSLNRETPLGTCSLVDMQSHPFVGGFLSIIGCTRQYTRQVASQLCFQVLTVQLSLDDTPCRGEIWFQSVCLVHTWSGIFLCFPIQYDYRRGPMHCTQIILHKICKFFGLNCLPSRQELSLLGQLVDPLQIVVD